ncbi:50S ribosomal protein L21, mitochondrial [Ricinus communis]|uniref:Large ribosomal subunit protein bL21m n=1 Tax=Ricinus communis TaxID=3988 RepID=B9RZ99_RICCO|nr:50S ribosomal protein L21, mitochondrial [Ricinus communis]EEF43279.1 50S ribosomal protein L21, mitochondrial precursor, putative [Ricinus communis]|eukprot:XP_002519068.1 50S ribosomal protein L21, mitochondrial [Ricinus communis]
MAQRRRLHSLTRQVIAIISSNPTQLHHTVKLPSFPSSLSIKTLRSSLIFTNTNATCHSLWSHHHHRNHRYFSSDYGDKSENDETEDDGSDSDGEEVTESDLKREYTLQEKEEEAAAIGYKVIGPLGDSERVIKAYEPVFAVIQIGSHQFKVSNGDCIFTERLKFCDVNDKLILNKVLLVGSQTQTIVGRPMVPDAVVHAIVEEHALDAKVIIFKKKRRKNYRRTKGHRQELTKLRITDIQGIEKAEMKVKTKPRKVAVKKQEEVPTAA